MGIVRLVPHGAAHTAGETEAQRRGGAYPSGVNGEACRCRSPGSGRNGKGMIRVSRAFARGGSVRPTALPLPLCIWWVATQGGYILVGEGRVQGEELALESTSKTFWVG